MKSSAVIRNAFSSVGLFVSRYPPPDSLGRLLREVCSRKSVDCVLDVGASDGRYVKLLRKDAGYEGRIISFEPDPQSFKLMSRACEKDSLWHGYQMALGLDNAAAVLHRFRSPDYNSLLLANSYGIARSRGMKEVGIETVQVRRLADILDEVLGEASPERLFLKTDTQGLDLAVIEGAVPVLERFVGIQAELSLKPIYDDVPSFRRSTERLTELGFEIAGLFPVARDSDMLRVVDFDCVAVRPS